MPPALQAHRPTLPLLLCRKRTFFPSATDRRRASQLAHGTGRVNGTQGAAATMAIDFWEVATCILMPHPSTSVAEVTRAHSVAQSAVHEATPFRQNTFVQLNTLLPLSVSGVKEPAHETETGSAEQVPSARVVPGTRGEGTSNQFLRNSFMTSAYRFHRARVPWSA